MSRRTGILTVLAYALACTGRSNPDAADANRSHVRAREQDTIAMAHGSLEPGIYVASWLDGRHSRWLALYANRVGEAMTYSNAEVTPLCTVSVAGDSVRFMTGTMQYWPTDQHFTFSFRGSRSLRGVSGHLQMNGGPYNGQEFLTEFRFYALDTVPTAADTSLEGLYGLVTLNRVTGDVLGDELLLVKTVDGFSGLFTDYEGVPDGPYPSQSVAVDQDTVRVGVNLFAPDPPTPMTFIIRHPDAGGETHDPSPQNIEDPRYVAKKATIAELFGASSSSDCIPQRQSRSND